MTKIFAHRGYIKNSKNKIAENSIQALDNTIKNNFFGVEFDIFYLQKNFYICHDKPKISDLKNLPTITDYFKYQNKLHYWLDFKNITLENHIEAFTNFKTHINQNNINLNNLYFTPYNTNLTEAKILSQTIKNLFGDKAKFMLVCDQLKTPNCQKTLLNFLNSTKINHLSLNKDLILKNPNFTKTLQQNKIKIFAWTIKSAKTHQALKTQKINHLTSDIKLTP